MKSEFEEKQFETLFVAESATAALGVGLVPVGQFLEASLGYDIGMLLPDAHPLVTLLGATGLSGSAVELGTTAVRRANVFFQFKRSERLTGGRRAYRDDLGNYFRFKIDRRLTTLNTRQQETLLALENGQKGRALVRYVAPVFWEYSTLFEFADTGQVAANSEYVAPSRFGQYHDSCMFNGQMTLLNPDQEQIEREPLEAVQTSVVNLETPDLQQSLSSIAALCPRPDLATRLLERVDDAGESGVLRELARAAITLISAGVTWRVAVLPTDVAN